MELRYNDNPSASANSVSFWRIETLPEGASSSGFIMASALAASRSRINALTGPCDVADSDSERYPKATSAIAPIGVEAISPHSDAFFLAALAFCTISRSARRIGADSVSKRSETFALPRSTA